MKFFVNNNCIGCGLCAGTCPEVFEMTDEGHAKAIESEVSANVLGSAKEAETNCPVSAIEND